MLTKLVSTYKQGFLATLLKNVKKNTQKLT